MRVSHTTLGRRWLQKNKFATNSAWRFKFWTYTNFDSMKLPMSRSAFWVGLAWLRNANRWLRRRECPVLALNTHCTSVRHRGTGRASSPRWSCAATCACPHALRLGAFRPLTVQYHAAYGTTLRWTIHSETTIAASAITRPFGSGTAVANAPAAAAVAPKLARHWSYPSCMPPVLRHTT